MSSLKNLKLSSWLSRKTELKPVIRNETRWRGTFLMIQRYFELYEFISDISPNDPDWVQEVRTYDLSEYELSRLRTLFTQLKKIDEVTLLLQSDDISMLSCRFYLDELLQSEENMVMGCKISLDAENVPDRSFESGIIKIMRNEINELTTSEKTATKHLRKDTRIVEGRVIVDSSLDTVSRNEVEDARDISLKLNST
jgi:hypothetical protein